MHFVRYALVGVGMALSAAAASAPIFVLNSLDANVSIIDPATYKELRRVPTGKEPHHLYLTPDEKSLMVANATGDTITLMDPRTGDVQRTLTGIVDPYQLQFSPDMKWFVTAANRLDHIDIYAWKPLEQGFDLTLVKRIPAGKTPSHIMIDRNSTTAYVTLQDSDQLIAIDLATQTPKWTVPVGKTPADVFLTPDQKTLLVALTVTPAMCLLLGDEQFDRRGVHRVTGGAGAGDQGGAVAALLLRAHSSRSMRVLPRVLGLTRARSRNSAIPSSGERSSWL